MRKTSYEMRISDGSSDVGSSDLGDGGHAPRLWRCREEPRGSPRDHALQGLRAGQPDEAESHHAQHPVLPQPYGDLLRLAVAHLYRCGTRPHREQNRSEEHTSELQPIMRISFDVFSLKNKKTTLK